MFLEIELKLSIEENPEHIALLFNHPLLMQSKPFSEELISRYFDTENLCLWKQGLSLRTRKAESGIIQTLKTNGMLLGELQHRQEWDQPIKGNFPDIYSFEDQALPPKLANIIGNQPLIELFHTRFKRTQWDLETEDRTKIELVLDQGTVNTAKQRIPLHEIELELKQGDINQIHKIADCLKQTIPLTLETQSKAERGYKLYCMDPPNYQ